MKYSNLLAFAFLMKNGLALPNYPSPASNGYGSPQKCTYVDVVEYTEKCEEYLGITNFLGILIIWNLSMIRGYVLIQTAKLLIYEINR